MRAMPFSTMRALVTSLRKIAPVKDKLLSNTSHFVPISYERVFSGAISLALLTGLRPVVLLVMLWSSKLWPKNELPGVEAVAMLA